MKVIIFISLVIGVIADESPFGDVHNPVDAVYSPLDDATIYNIYEDVKHGSHPANPPVQPKPPQPQPPHYHPHPNPPPQQPHPNPPPQQPHPKPPQTQKPQLPPHPTHPHHPHPNPPNGHVPPTTKKPSHPTPTNRRPAYIVSQYNEEKDGVIRWGYVDSYGTSVDTIMYPKKLDEENTVYIVQGRTITWNDDNTYNEVQYRADETGYNIIKDVVNQKPAKPIKPGKP